MSERCTRCHTILTSEDKHWYQVSCELCEQDMMYAEHFDSLPFQAAGRYVRYQLRWLRNTVTAGLGICLRPVLRWLDGKREQSNARRER